MAANISIWLRAFRPSLERAYPREEDETELELADLLRRADERSTEADPQPPPKRTCGETEISPPHADAARRGCNADAEARPPFRR